MRPAGVLAALVLLAGCGSGGHDRSAAATTTTTKPPVAVPSTTTTVLDLPGTDLAAFQTPTKNIGCELDATQARCDIATRVWSPPPKPADCELDWGQGISVAPGKPATFVCAGDTALSNGPILPYGHAVRRGPITCVSDEQGVTCRDEQAHHGFVISRESYGLF